MYRNDVKTLKFVSTNLHVITILKILMLFFASSRSPPSIYTAFARQLRINFISTHICIFIYH